jgi:hypothetical protein
MATNRDLLKEAIADAKAVKETAIANAKAALTESFTPFLREKLSAKIQEMDDAEMDDMYDDVEAEDTNEGLDEISLDELLAELEEMEAPEMEEENLYEAKEEEEEDEEMSIEDMDEDDLKSFIEDVIKDMVSAGELEAGHEGMENEEGAEEMEAPEEEEEMESEEEEVDLDELLAEIELDEYSKKSTDSTPKSKNAIFSKGKDEYVTDETEEDDVPYSAKKAEKLSFHENEVEEAFGLGAKLKGALGLGAGKEEDFLKAVEKTSNKMLANKKKAEYDEFKKKAEAGDEMAAKIIAGIIKHAGSNEDLFYMIDPKTGEVKQTKSYSVKDSGVQMGEGELEEAYAAIKTLQSELNEINLLNSKLLYTNKIFRSKSLSESQKIKVLTAFDKAKTKKEAQLVYETLLESLKVSTVGAKTSIKESLGSASKVLGSANAKPIIDVDNQFARWQTLAGINKK